MRKRKKQEKEPKKEYGRWIMLPEVKQKEDSYILPDGTKVKSTKNRKTYL